MRLKTIALVAVTAAVAAACSPAPGSAEWCKGLLDGSIKPSQEDAMNHGPKCAEGMLKDLMGGLGQ